MHILFTRPLDECSEIGDLFEWLQRAYINFIAEDGTDFARGGEFYLNFEIELGGMKIGKLQVGSS